MKVLIISANRNLYPEPVMPAGACMAAEAAHRAGHEVKFLDLMFERAPLPAVRQAIKDFEPDATGLSIRNIDNNDLSGPARFYEEPGAIAQTIRQTADGPLIIGGAALSVMPRELMVKTGADIAVLADGEKVFPAVLDALSSGRTTQTIEGTARMENGLFVSVPFTKRPMPACPPPYEKWLNTRRYLSMLSTAPMLTKIGCHFECVYCTYRKLDEKAPYGLMEPKEAACNIERLFKTGFRDIEFVDNVFNSPPGHAVSICEEVIKRKVRARLHTVELNPLFISEELVRAMEKAGFAGVGITAESASDPVLERLKKGFRVEHLIKAAQIMRKSSLPCLWIFMLGGPGETPETVSETLRFSQKYLKPNDAVFFNAGIRIYPKTGLEEIARREGLLSLAPADMLEPVFYLSPHINFDWLLRQVEGALDGNLNMIDIRSIQSGYLPWIRRAFSGLGMKPPLWRHTAAIRRGMRFLGIEKSKNQKNSGRIE